MKHYTTVGDNISIEVEIFCDHPELRQQHNTCPTGQGNCHECRWSKTEMPTKDFFKLYEALRKE